ncbi:MAG: hypothetical protein WCA30_10490 [Dermatophilaceae bacterium]
MPGLPARQAGAARVPDAYAWLASTTPVTVSSSSRSRHVAAVRQHVIDALPPEQIDQLIRIGDALLTRLDPDGRMNALLGEGPSPG